MSGETFQHSYLITHTSYLLLQQHHRRAPSPTRSIRILKRFDEVERFEQRADALPLHADAPSVDQPHLPEAAHTRAKNSSQNCRLRKANLAVH